MAAFHVSRHGPDDALVQNAMREELAPPNR